MRTLIPLGEFSAEDSFRLPMPAAAMAADTVPAEGTKLPNIGIWQLTGLVEEVMVVVVVAVIVVVVGGDMNSL